MSPYIRTMLEDAADDGGRPVALDLDAVRAAGRRATWRRRALIGASGIGAAAVVTSVALLVAPGGAAPFGPATGSNPDDPKSVSIGELPADPGAEALENALAPLIGALRDRGLDVAIQYGSSSGQSTSGEGSGEVQELSSSSTGLAVKHTDGVGAAVVAEFTDRSALGVGGDDDMICAEIPVLAENFAWESCEPYGDNGKYLLATGGDSLGDAVGVTLVRVDGSGISVALSTSAYDPAQSEPALPPLAKLPLTHMELVDIVDELDARAPLSLLPTPEPTTEPTATGGPPPDGPVGTVPRQRGTGAVVLEHETMRG